MIQNLIPIHKKQSAMNYLPYLFIQTTSKILFNPIEVLSMIRKIAIFSLKIWKINWHLWCEIIYGWKFKKIKNLWFKNGNVKFKFGVKLQCLGNFSEKVVRYGNGWFEFEIESKYFIDQSINEIKILAKNLYKCRHQNP